GRILDAAATGTRPPGWRQPIRWVSGEGVPDPGNFSRNTALIDLIAAFDEEFGWSTADRSLYAAWSSPMAADSFKWLLACVLQARQVRTSGYPARLDGHGIPVIDAADAAMLFGANADPYLQLLRRAHAIGHWPVSWSWRAFVLAPLWAFGQGLYGYM